MQQPILGVPYVGSKITLISRSGFRYEGTLFTIDSVQGTVALREVTIIGTDGNPLPGSKTYEYIVFKGSDIKDLTVNSTPQQNVPTQPVQQKQPQFYGQTQFPTYNTQPVKTEKKVEEVKKEEKVVEKKPVQKKEPVRETSQQKPSPQKKEYKKPEEKKEEKKPTQSHTDYKKPRQDNRDGSQHKPQQKKPQEKVKYDKDFDFETSTTQFVKGIENDQESKKKKEEILKNVTHYEKDSFFDSISRESTSKTFDREAQKKRDVETFGTAYAHHHRGGRGGRYRGNRGRGGRGRGQSNENQ